MPDKRTWRRGEGKAGRGGALIEHGYHMVADSRDSREQAQAATHTAHPRPCRRSKAGPRRAPHHARPPHAPTTRPTMRPATPAPH